MSHHVFGDARAEIAASVIRSDREKLLGDQDGQLKHRLILLRDGSSYAATPHGGHVGGYASMTPNGSGGPKMSAYFIAQIKIHDRERYRRYLDGADAILARHTGEVDCYHQGRFAGLGSRHNVRHWGCGAKEARISQAPYRRYYYYLTTDERTGDIMREMLQADERIAEVDPMRLAQPITEAEKKYPARLRLGPDWFALAGNWMTEWERTGDTKWRDKIYAGIDSICKMPLGLRTGRNLVMGFDPKTSELYQLSDEAGVYNLATIMGGA